MKSEILIEVSVALKQNHSEQLVSNFIEYIQKAGTETKNGKLKMPFLSKTPAKTFIHLFNKVAEAGLVIDGETVFLSPINGKASITYSYLAYKNKVLLSYPESLFDFQVVRDGDTFEFEKENGKVWYKHKIGSAFNTEAKIVGAYGIIRNSRGEFIELLNTNDIAKMKGAAKQKYIWDAWESRMILKSVIKRVCKTYFHDLVSKIDEIDNENYDLKPKFDQKESDEKHRKKRIIDWIYSAQSISELKQCEVDIKEEDADLAAMYNNKAEQLEAKEIAHQEKISE